MMKKVLSLFLSILMLCSITAGVDLSVQAAGNTYTSGKYTYTVSNGEVTITGYSGSASSLTIPSKLGGYKVTAIGEWVFAKTDKLKSIVIPDSVRAINDYAFYDSAIENITIGENVKSIGNRAFASCVNLKNITIPDSVTTIGDGVFYCCRAIESIKIGSGLTSFGFDTLPHGMMVSYKLKKITVSESNKYFSSQDGVLFNKDKTILLCYPDSKSTGTYYVPETVTKIADGAFIATVNLKNVICPKSVKTISEGAFFCCCLTSFTVLNKNCKIGSSNYFDGESETATVFKGLKNSTLQAYAKENGYTFKTVKDAYSYKAALSKTSYTYDGNAKKPSVTVKDNNGKKLTKGTDYTVAYSSNKSVGKATVTVKFKGSYSGIITKTYIIKPKATSISSVTANSKGFTVKWSKVTTQTTGYQVQYSTSSDFSSKTTKTISSNSTTSKKITGLKAKKKYYVRVRTYKTVKIDGKSTKIYSSWSSAKTVTTKK